MTSPPESFLRARVLAVLVASLAFAAPAAAAPRKVGPPKTSWSVSKIVQGAGKQVLGHNTTRARRFFKRFDLGHQGFAFDSPHFSENARPEVSWDRDGQAVLAQAPSLDRINPQGSPKGSVAHLNMLQAFEKDAGSASLRITLRQVLLELVDAQGPLSQFECPVVGSAPCPMLRSLVRVRVQASKLSGGRPLLDLGGAVYVEGHQHDWQVFAVTDSRSRGAFWEGALFAVSRDVGRNGSQSHVVLFAGNHTQIPLTVPLRSLEDGERFTVRVTMHAEAIDERGGESAAQAFVLDPEHAAPMVSSHGLERLPAPKLKEPAVRPQPAASCPAGPRRHAGRLQFSSGTFSVGEASGTPMVLVTRTGGARGATSVTVKTTPGSAQSGADYTRTRTRVRFEDGDSARRLVEIPIREDLLAEPPETFTVSLTHARCAKLGTRRTATVTILDDDQPPPPPPPSFTVGGTVEGLAGSGLVLVNRGTELHVTGNGPFTFPGTFPDGSTLDVRVQTQPTNPDQVCTVVGGRGTITADVSDVTVHCTTLPTGRLDTSFGTGGRVSVPGSGEARALVIQANGQRDGNIIAVGPRAVGTTFQSQFGAARFDTAGNLDLSFGTNGLAETRLGGADDKAFDAVRRQDDRFIAVGQADPSGLANTDFGVMAYTADGQPDVTFATGGFRTTDIAGHGDVARAIAIQSFDNKILVAGSAFTSPVDQDFAIVRYNEDGSLDTTFGGDGIVTTNFGTENDSASAISVDRLGTITVAGNAGEDIALARYGPDGELDPTLGGDGTVVSDLGFGEVANDVFLSFGDAILVAGTRLGPKLNAEAMVASYGANGKQNLGFGNNGVAEADFSDGNDSGDELTLDRNDEIVLVGTASSATVSDMALARFRLDGTLESTLTTDFHGAGDFGHDVAAFANGTVLAAGSTANGGDNQFALMRAFF
jgi:uncharacterized delta-60 repeat protein